MRLSDRELPLLTSGSSRRLPAGPPRARRAWSHQTWILRVMRVSIDCGVIDCCGAFRSGLSLPNRYDETMAESLIERAK
jgi:hypothetical protein